MLLCALSCLALGALLGVVGCKLLCRKACNIRVEQKRRKK